jgi:hypothetical protein
MALRRVFCRGVVAELSSRPFEVDVSTPRVGSALAAGVTAV